LVSILGGEPTIWPDLFGALEYCNNHRISTDLTTNGSLLNAKYLDRLSCAGLDLLNISVDSLSKTGASKKACLTKPGILDSIESHLRNKTLRIRVNAVICKNNYQFLTNLLEIVKNHGIPISLGFAMFRNPTEYDPDIHFNSQDINAVSGIIELLKTQKNMGLRLIDPIEYFENYEKFLNAEQFWVCNYSTHRGWINVDPYGYIRDCTKKMHRLEYDFTNLTTEQLLDVRSRLAEGVSSCNRFCYSNCAYDGAYFAKHKFQFYMSGVT